MQKRRSHGPPSHSDLLATAAVGWLESKGQKGQSTKIREICRQAGTDLPQKVSALHDWFEENFGDLRLHERLPDPSLVPKQPKKRGQSYEDARKNWTPEFTIFHDEHIEPLRESNSDMYKAPTI